MQTALVRDRLHLHDKLKLLVARLYSIQRRRSSRLSSSSDLSPWLQRDIGLRLRPDYPPRPLI